MKEFLKQFQIKEMTNTLWNKLLECFYSNCNIYKEIKSVEERMSEHKTRYYKFQKFHKENKYKIIEYDNNQDNRFKGIITELGRGKQSNVFNENIIEVSSSSVTDDDSDYQPKNVFNFNDDKNIFHSSDEPNSWFCYDFKERKVKLSHYSLKSHGYGGKTCSRVKTWVIEGSNDKQTWNIIDKRENEESVADVSASNIFKIDENISTNDFYQYIRIRQTAANNSSNNQLVFSFIEFFGTIIEP